MLDLGVWCALQAAVERTHYMRLCEVNALVHSVNETWENGVLDRSIQNVFNRLKKVLVLIIEGNGSNELVETKRGNQTVRADLPAAAEEVQNEELPNILPPVSLLQDFDDEDEDDVVLVACDM